MSTTHDYPYPNIYAPTPLIYAQQTERYQPAQRGSRPGHRRHGSNPYHPSQTPTLAPIDGSPISYVSPQSPVPREPIAEPEIGDIMPYPQADLESGNVPGRAPIERRSRGRSFVGGFVVDQLKRIPNAMMKNHARGSGSSFGVDVPVGSPLPQRTSFYSPAPSTFENFDFPPDLSTSSQLRYIPENPTQSMDVSNGMGDHGRYHENHPIAGDMTATPTHNIQSISDAQPNSTYSKVGADAHSSDDSWGGYLARIHKFIVDVKSLPWVSTQVAEVWAPTRNSAAKPATSWYSSKARATVDLVGPPVSATIATVPTMSQYAISANVTPYTTTVRSIAPSEGGMTAIRPVMSPTSATSAGGLPSPGASSHGLGSQTYSYSYYYGSPQPHRPLYGQPSMVSTPQTRLGSEGLFSPP